MCATCVCFLGVGRPAGHAQQLEACLKKFQMAPKKAHAIGSITETISGMLPLSKREHLVKLIEDPTISEIHVESCHAVACKAVGPEAMWELNEKHKMNIICTDYPQGPPPPQ